MSNMPSLGIKRAYEQIIKNDLGLKVVEGAVKTGTKKEIQVQIPGWTEDFEPVQLSSKHQFSTINLSINIFSEMNETGVMQAVHDLMQIPSQHPLLKEFKINSITPVSSFTDYTPESADGLIQAQIVIGIRYLMRKG